MAAFAYRFNEGASIEAGTQKYNIINQTIQKVIDLREQFPRIKPAYTIAQVGRPDNTFVITEEQLANAKLAPAGAARGRKSRRRKSRRRKNNRSNRKHV